ncbi:MAG: hypothetical protein L6365_14135 [Desulfobulbaceae bacterium]|nr:hypothetical protein [Desulfobulbaceae bacterium]
MLYNFGYQANAKQCFECVRTLSPKDLRPVVNLANLARDNGDHAESRRLYSELLSCLPDNLVIRRNVLVSLEYDPAVSDAERLSQATSWGQWAIGRAGGLLPRPSISASLHARPLRVGYVSADLCQHTVGLFVKDIIAGHDGERVTAFAYSAGKVSDGVTKVVRESCQFRQVADLDDAALANLIRQDDIDVLIDLSGHTAGSRLTVFAHRPAPVQVSWLGYFATTGLPVIDAVLLDDWHAPEGMESRFVERIIRLPRGRFYYSPMPFAPEVAPLPAARKDYITFGSFNNTAKYNDMVFSLWAKILQHVVDSRLVLKWRTFQDKALRKKVADNFTRLGIDPERIEMRGASFHADLLKEYADIDIALDPFPFSGGMTSCESLWMGVPVVTWPQSRVVCRQTYALLCEIGLPELSATDEVDYVRIAVDLAGNPEKLQNIRLNLRARMMASPLCDREGFIQSFEDTLWNLVDDLARTTECGELTS